MTSAPRRNRSTLPAPIDHRIVIRRRLEILALFLADAERPDLALAARNIAELLPSAVVAVR